LRGRPQPPSETQRNNKTMGKIVKLRQSKPLTALCRVAGTLLMASLAFVFCGCGANLAPIPYSTEIFRDPTTLGPGDELEIRFRFNPELDAITTVRPDGKITLQIIDDVAVDGLTPEELDTKLTALYADDLISPVLSVFVTTVASQRVYVGGEVRNQGVVPLVDRMTALDAVISAGGFIRETAKPKSVVLIRTVNGKRESMTLDLRKPLTEPESGMVYLEPLDIVYVSRTRVSKVNQWVQQYITNMIPGLGNFGAFLAGP
jgi:protein involved in polysaccharide export with SLBB domain